MAEFEKAPDEESGEIDHCGVPRACSQRASTNEASTPSVSLCESPTITDEKDSRPSLNSGTSTTKTPKEATWLQNLVARCRTSIRRSPQRMVNVQAVHLTPRGYPRLAAFLDSDDNFKLYRRFGYLQSRVLLEKQDDLRQLERELERLDEQDREANEELLRTRDPIDLDEMEQSYRSAAGNDTESLEADNTTRRKQLLKLIAINIKEYGEQLTAAQTSAAMNKPTAGEQCSVRNWLENIEPVHQADASFMEHTEDLITLRPGREHAWLDAGVEKVLRRCKVAFIQNLFRSRETKLKTDRSGGEVYFTRQRIERLVIFIITGMILALLIVPIWLLYHITAGVQTQRSVATCIGILLVFTLAFSACISLFTRAQRHEILAAAAGYCAVLVVFLGNVNGGFGRPTNVQ